MVRRTRRSNPHVEGCRCEDCLIIRGGIKQRYLEIMERAVELMERLAEKLDDGKDTIPIPAQWPDYATPTGADNKDTLSQPIHHTPPQSTLHPHFLTNQIARRIVAIVQFSKVPHEITVDKVAAILRGEE